MIQDIINEKYNDIGSNLDTTNNDLLLSKGVQAINNSIGNILTIRKYEVAGQPAEFIDLYKYLHEHADVLTFMAIKQEVKDALFRWEKRIEVVDVITEMVEESSTLLLIQVFWRLRETNENFQTLVKLQG